jgi:hypothetical protein
MVKLSNLFAATAATLIATSIPVVAHSYVLLLTTLHIEGVP